MKKIIIIGFVWPEPNSTAAGSRMLQLIQLFLSNNYKVTFASVASQNEKSYKLEALGIETNSIQLNSASFDTFIKKINPEIVLFDRYITEEQFGWRVAENCPNALRILDTEDLHFLRNARFVSYKKKCELTPNLLINDITKREVASIYRCDLTLIISKYELKLLKKTFNIPKQLLFYIPFLFDSISEKAFKLYPSFEQRINFMTIGNFKHEPNWNAIVYLKETIWPLIRKELPKANLTIYGAYSSQKVEQLHNKKEGFLIEGWVESTEKAFSNAKICLAPLQFGAGLKGKLIDAMKYGTPSITTTIGAEAMHQKLQWNGCIEDDPKKFAERAVEFYKNKMLWKQAQQNGVKIINQCYLKEKFESKFINQLEYVLKNIELHRFNNFIGAMLTHHTLKSTKYLSKWIEEKNKI
ncbi:glycosyltransferase family 4 protein [uncultured Lutibacter sp.]|uniref:glycosyltransferase family 4 protein n=1 Tax=uncultured Lutibacter sp. TaxID=437739 RepID=UPI002610DB4F|nr:glycosyltransferase family 4 protein [uncultured Lutibacter sp.]